MGGRVTEADWQIPNFQILLIFLGVAILNT